MTCYRVSNAADATCEAETLYLSSHSLFCGILIAHSLVFCDLSTIACLFFLCPNDHGIVDCVFEPRLGQTNDYKIYICCFTAKHVHAALRRKIKDGWLGIRIMCPSEATLLSADSCFSELTLFKSK